MLLNCYLTTVGWISYKAINNYPIETIDSISPQYESSIKYRINLTGAWIGCVPISPPASWFCCRCSWLLGESSKNRQESDRNPRPKFDRSRSQLMNRIFSARSNSRCGTVLNQPSSHNRINQFKVNASILHRLQLSGEQDVTSTKPQ